MTSRERVLLSFAHREPDRVPSWCGSSPEFWEKAKQITELDDEGLRRRLGDDFRRVFAVYKGPDKGLSPGATWRSPFGVERMGIGYGQPLTHPLAAVQTEADVLDFEWPNPDWVDVGGLRADASAFGGEYAVLGGDWSPFWHDVIDLLGMENLFYLMFDRPELVSLIFKKVTDYYYAVSERIFETAADLIDIFFIGNDFGSKSGPLIGTDLFERFIAPELKRLIDLGHRYGLKVMLHCCGGFKPLIPLMIRDGLDGLHALQPYCAGMEPSSLKHDFGSQILLNGAIDSQRFLIEGNEESVRQETLRILSIMSKGGGYVAGASHDYILPETPVQNVLAMFDTIRDYRRD